MSAAQQLDSNQENIQAMSKTQDLDIFGCCIILFPNLGENIC
jgi:hypothetical protein